MRTESNTQADTAFGITITVPWRICKVEPCADHCLYVEFMDGPQGYVYIKPSHLWGVFEPLKDPNFFNQVFIDHGAVTWPGEIDLAPDAMYMAIKKNGAWVLD